MNPLATSLSLDLAAVPEPDLDREPSGFVVTVEPNDRIHFLDWGGPPGAARVPGILLIHGLASTAWSWTPVARRLCRVRRTVAMDLRGHGLSDAPTEGYDELTMAGDAEAVAEGSGVLRDGDPPIVLAGHGFGAIAAAWAAAALGDRCARLVLIDGGFEDLAATSGLEGDEFLRSLEEPPEVLRSMAAYLRDRKGFDPPSWDGDQERAARATVVETAAGRVVPVTRPHALAASVGAMFDYRAADVLTRVVAPMVALVAAENEDGTRAASLMAAQAALRAADRPAIAVAGFPSDGHNLMRYRPREVAAAILGSPVAAAFARG